MLDFKGNPMFYFFLGGRFLTLRLKLKNIYCSITIDYKYPVSIFMILWQIIFYLLFRYLLMQHLGQTYMSCNNITWSLTTQIFAVNNLATHPMIGEQVWTVVSWVYPLRTPGFYWTYRSGRLANFRKKKQQQVSVTLKNRCWFLCTVHERYISSDRSLEKPHLFW